MRPISAVSDNILTERLCLQVQVRAHHLFALEFYSPLALYLSDCCFDDTWYAQLTPLRSPCDLTHCFLSAICVECFKEANHEGHDFRLIRVGGGCCDCGDDQAVRPAGFCRQHAGSAQSADPLSALSAEVNASAKAVLGVVAKFLAESVQSDKARPCGAYRGICVVLC